jgi:UDP-MurNAc hydroxylase
MRITFVGHASILVDSAGRSILCDPWLESKVFNNGWALLSPPCAVDFGALNYIWFSHEHPDHLNFPTLKRISAEDKQRITVLYQRHPSTRIVDAIRKLGFPNIVELPTFAWTELEPGLQLFCGTQGQMDSFLAIRDVDTCVLNLNDCHFNPRQLHYINRRLGGPVDIAFAQFSFANWVGNDGDEIGEVEEKRNQLRDCSRIIKPRSLVPFASYVYFCSEENRRMNAWVNTPADIARLDLPGLEFMYPGDCWDSAQPSFQSESAVQRYMQDYARMQIDPTPPMVPVEDVLAAARQRLSALAEAVDQQPLLKTYVWLRGLQLSRMPPLDILLHDVPAVVSIDPASGVCEAVDATPERAARARFVMCSQVAWYTFAFGWGGGTTQVSGMYLDRHYAERGPHPLFSLQETISCEAFTTPNRITWRRVVSYWWRKWRIEALRTTGRSRGRDLDGERVSQPSVVTSAS